MSYEFNIAPNRKVFVRFLGEIHDELYEAFTKRAEEEGLTKSDLAKKLGVHKSLITRKFNGTSNLTIESIADLAWGLNHLPKCKLIPLEKFGGNQTVYHQIYSSSPNITMFSEDITLPDGLPAFIIDESKVKVKTA